LNAQARRRRAEPEKNLSRDLFEGKSRLMHYNLLLNKYFGVCLFLSGFEGGAATADCTQSNQTFYEAYLNL
jgi:hypothetical protein